MPAILTFEQISILRSDAGATFDASEAPQVVRDVIEWYDASLRRVNTPIEGPLTDIVNKQRSDPKLSTSGATAYERYLFHQLSRLQQAVLADAKGQL